MRKVAGMWSRYSLILILTLNLIVLDLLEVKGDLDLAGNLQYIYTKVSPLTQEEAATGTLQRLLPTRWSEFRIRIDQSLSSSKYQDAFSVDWENQTGRILVTGTTGVSALFGLIYYLKYACGAHVSWDGDQVTLPVPLPRVSYRKSILDRFRYYQNVCTESYSFAWWGWKRWEREIDWMALNGINLPLAFTGQEAIWQRVYMTFGLTQAQIDDYVSGPAFLAWWRMGNIHGFGGPIPPSYVSGKLRLLGWIVERMRNLGMTPVLPAFAGNVPEVMTSYYPNTSFIQLPAWNGFNSSYSSTFMLDPTEPLFIEIGKRFMTELIREVGTDHVYACDTFNENRPSSGDPEFLRAVAKATFKSMTAVDPKAVWIMQGWVFTDADFWTKDRVRSYLSGVDVGNLIVLDLIAESVPLFIPFESFFNHSFIWSMLHNFGGTINLFGNLAGINQDMPAARKLAKPGTLIGIGLSPEGINQNYVMYDFMTEMTLIDEPLNLTEWISNYAIRRYGKSTRSLRTAWGVLQNGVYNAPRGLTDHGHSILTDRPGLNKSENRWYSPLDLRRVIRLMLPMSSRSGFTSSLYEHDLVDFSRQFLVYLGGLTYLRMMFAFDLNDTAGFRNSSKSLLQVLDDLDIILKTSKNFLLGSWVKAAEGWGTTPEEKQLLRLNALNQITLWGPSGEILDYATKQWSGVVSHYYKPRWELFIHDLGSALTTGIPFNRTRFNENVLTQVERPFAEDRGTIFPTVPSGDTILETGRIFKRWGTIYSTLSKAQDLRYNYNYGRVGNKY